MLRLRLDKRRCVGRVAYPIGRLPRPPRPSAGAQANPMDLGRLVLDSCLAQILRQSTSSCLLAQILRQSTSSSMALRQNPADRPLAPYHPLMVLLILSGRAPQERLTGSRRQRVDWFGNFRRVPPVQHLLRCVAFLPRRACETEGHFYLNVVLAKIFPAPKLSAQMHSPANSKSRGVLYYPFFSGPTLFASESTRTPFSRTLKHRPTAYGSRMT